jgi:hypothetical protein
MEKPTLQSFFFSRQNSLFQNTKGKFGGKKERFLKSLKKSHPFFLVIIN